MTSIWSPAGRYSSRVSSWRAPGMRMSFTASCAFGAWQMGATTATRLAALRLGDFENLHLPLEGRGGGLVAHESLGAGGGRAGLDAGILGKRVAPLIGHVGMLGQEIGDVHE